MSDNGQQFVSEEHHKFSKSRKFQRITSSPRHPQSNGRVENAVQAVKCLMKKAKKDNADVYLAALDYRNTPTQGSESSPVQRLMSRRTKTLLPTTAKLLAPRVVQNHHQEIVKGQERQAKYYNRRSKDLPRLKKEGKVRVQDHGQRVETTKRDHFIQKSVRCCRHDTSWAPCS